MSIHRFPHLGGTLELRLVNRRFTSAMVYTKQLIIPKALTKAAQKENVAFHNLLLNATKAAGPFRFSDSTIQLSGIRLHRKPHKAGVLYALYFMQCDGTIPTATILRELYAYHREIMVRIEQALD